MIFRLKIEINIKKKSVFYNILTKIANYSNNNYLKREQN